MAIVYNEFKEDVSAILDGIQREDRPLASPKKAFKLSSRFPVLMLLTNICILLFAFVIYVFDGDNAGLGLTFYAKAFLLFMDAVGWYTLSATIAIGLCFSLVFYTAALVYTSIPREISVSSKVLGAIKQKLRKIAKFMWLLSIGVSLVGVFFGNFILLYTIPMITFLSIFVINFYLGTETVRYGLGPLVKRLSRINSNS